MIFYVDSLEENTDSLANIKRLIKLLPTVKYIGLDTETNGLDPYMAQVLLVQIKVNDDIFILNRGKLGKDFITNLVNLINKNNILCIGHNIKFDIKMLKQDIGIWVSNVYDTMVLEAVLTSGLGSKFTSLRDLVKKYCDVELEKGTTLEFLELDHSSSFTERQITYSAKDVLYLFDIYNKQQELILEANLGKIAKLEMDVLPVVAQMELSGIGLDVDHWNALTRSAEKKANELSKQIKDLLLRSVNPSRFENAYEFARAVAIPITTKKLQKSLELVTDPLAVMSWINETFNLHSHKQLLTALNLAGIETEDTNEKTLNKLPKSDIIDLILEYRDYEKKISTYGDNVVASVNPVTGRIHADFNQVGASSGRFSSSGGVNMQNIPSHGGYREGFIARPGFSFLSADYSQCEYRLVGALSGEPVIIDAYIKGSDMHIATASLKFNKMLADISSEERDLGKTLNFAVIYGTSVWGLEKNLSIPKKEAQKLLDDYWAGYPRLLAFKTSYEEKILDLRYAVTPMGRRRYFKHLPAFATPREVERNDSKIKREAFNMCIQGGTADVLKVAMIDMGQRNPFGDKFSLLLQVHDELLAEVDDSILKEAEEFMVQEMIAAFQPFLGKIPAMVDSHTSKRWTKE